MDKFKKELMDVVEGNLDFSTLPEYLTSKVIVTNMIQSIGSSARLAHMVQSHPELFEKHHEMENLIRKDQS